MILRQLLIPALVLGLAGCQTPTPISANPLGDLASPPNAGPAAAPVVTTVVQGLQDAAFNLDNAVAVGALPPDDPAPTCLHGVLQQIGAEIPAGGPAPKSFTPRESDLISIGSVLYIRAQQAKKLAGGGVTIPLGCKALIGQFVVDAGQAGLRVAGSTLPGLAVLGVPLQ